MLLVLAFRGTLAEKPPEIHACTDGNGNVTYQSDPCDEAIPAPIAKPTRAVAPSPPPAPRTPVSIPRVVPTLEEDELPAERIGPADPRLASPRQTWRTFLDAMRNGDRALAAACLTSSALRESGHAIESLPVEKLRERADALPEIDIGGDAGPFRVATARQRGLRPKWIFFEKSRNGDWKIAAM
jgi:hypothetical protein